ncbi:hypothetical protein L1987_81081 [Smallanthus sonchifolius]|uniref:Uncharacterized protein n=1 Tax=Smallanthus sonchifolius TaxID=185202 RepID=A0ACB8YQK3_9ASTR|nr:hypothetical protein L1987_81081 [Smallanthus sonchifolius]
MASNCVSPLKCLVDEESFNYSYLIYEGLPRIIQRSISKYMFLVYPIFLQMIFNDKLQNLNKSGPTLDLQHMRKRVFNNIRSKSVKMKMIVELHNRKEDKEDGDKDKDENQDGSVKYEDADKDQGDVGMGGSVSSDTDDGDGDDEEVFIVPSTNQGSKLTYSTAEGQVLDNLDKEDKVDDSLDHQRGLYMVNRRGGVIQYFKSKHALQSLPRWDISKLSKLDIINPGNHSVAFDLQSMIQSQSSYGFTSFKLHRREFHISAYSKMIRLQTYAGLSVVATLAVIYHAFSSRGQFYPATVYLSTSKVCLVLLLNMGLVIMCIMWQLTKLIFLGSLREAEVERLNEQSWREVMEILFAITIFRQDFSVMFLAMVTALLLVKSLHWLAQKRVEYIETTPTVTTLSHVRIVSFMGFLLVIDCLFLYNSVKYLIQTRQASVSLFFSFEYMILATTTISTFVKYVFYVSDMLMEGQWEKKAVYTFYLELIRDLLHLSMYLCFFLVIFVNYGVPLHLIRELYETFRNFKLRIADYIRYRKITSNMNDRFPDATPEELNASDATCIICREEMTTAKRLVCGHLFHVHCLRSWLERQHTCPICRALVIPNEGGTTTTRSQPGAHHQGANSENTSPQNQNGDAAGDENISRHQKRLQAAAAAASIYQKSFVYPSPSTLTWSSGYALHPNKSTPGTGIINGEHDNSVLNNPANFPSFQFPQTGFIPAHASANPEDGWNTNLQMSVSQLEAQKKIIQQQIEKAATEKNSVAESSSSSWEVDLSTTSSDGKGKAVVSSSSLSDSGVDQSQHGEMNHNHDDVNISPL